MNLTGSEIRIAELGVVVTVTSNPKPDQISFYNPRAGCYQSRALQPDDQLMTEEGPVNIPQPPVMPNPGGLPQPVAQSPSAPQPPVAAQPPAAPQPPAAVAPPAQQQVPPQGPPPPQAAVWPDFSKLEPLDAMQDPTAEIGLHLSGAVLNHGAKLAHEEITPTWSLLEQAIYKQHSDQDPRNLLARWLVYLAGAGLKFDLADLPKEGEQPPANPVSDSPVPQVATPEDLPETPKVPSAPAGDEVPTDPEQLAAYDRLGNRQCGSMRGLKTRLTKTHKMDWSDYCQQFGLDKTTGLPAGDQPAQPQATQPAASQPSTPPPAGPGAPTLQNQPANTPQGQPQPVSAPQTPPVGYQPAQQQTLPGVPGLPDAQPAPDAPAPAATAQAAPAVQPQPTQTQPVQPMVQTMDRAQIAQSLGGEVTLMLVKLPDLGSIQKDGWIDANQLAQMAERETVRQMSVEDLADIKGFQKGDQVKARIFNDLITQHPNVYIIKQGYDWIFPGRMVTDLMARVTRAIIVQDGGQRTDEVL